MMTGTAVKRGPHRWVKGKSGNPGGRKAMAPEVREAIHVNGTTGVQRMQQLLNDDTAWGAKGWLDAKTQVKLAETAMLRAFGPNPVVEREAGSAPGEVRNLGDVLRQVYDAMREEGDVPEFINARRADLAVDVTPEEDDDDDD